MVFIPINAASAGFSVILPLLILITLRGNILEVALAQTLYNSALIPAAMVWGFVADRFQTRAPLLVLNYAAFGVVFLLLGSYPSFGALLVIYTVYGFVAPSSAAASNLLILERFPAGSRASAFASFSELSVVGNILGLLAGFFWLLGHGSGGTVVSFLYVTAALAFLSAVGVAVFIRDPVHRLSRETIVRIPESLAVRLRHNIPFFLFRRPRVSWVRRSAQWLRREATHEVPLILLAGFLFSTATNLFNTSYIPYLQEARLTAASIFLVNLANNVGQAIVLPLTAGACQGNRMERVVVRATWTRTAGYVAVAGLAVFPILITRLARGDVLGTNLVAYGVLGVGAAFYGTASSLLLFRSLGRRNPGSLLGANSALGGLAAVLGAAASGVLSFRFGYGMTFGTSATVMAVSVPVWYLAIRSFRERANGEAGHSAPS